MQDITKHPCYPFPATLTLLLFPSALPDYWDWTPSQYQHVRKNHLVDMLVAPDGSGEMFDFYLSKPIWITLSSGAAGWA